MSKIKILFLSSAPKDRKNKLDLDNEFRRISEGIQTGSCKDFIEVFSVGNVRSNQLPEILLKYKPDIVHFSSHGNESNGILLEDRNGKSEYVDKDLLTEIFTHVADKTRLVILNTCHSNEQAKAIAKVVGCAIGVHGAISDIMAIEFSASFYRNIAFGESIQKAFVISLIDLKLLKYDEGKFPILYSEKINADLVLSKRRGYFLLSNYDMWECYITVLDFSKQIHHIFQTLGGDLHLNMLVSEIGRLEQQCLYENKKKVHDSWEIYSREKNSLFGEFYSKFPEYGVSISNSLDRLKKVDNSDIAKLVIECREYFISINKMLEYYYRDDKSLSDYMKNTLIDKLVVQCDLSIARNLKQYSDQLTVDSDNFLRKLITILLYR